MTARVEFFETDSPRLDIVVCRKAVELYSAGERLCILTPTAAEAALLDALLWTFDDQAFVPHANTSGRKEAEVPVAVTAEEGNPNGATTLLVAGNVEKEVLLASAEHFDVIIDFAPKSPKNATEQARERYRLLSAAGLKVGFTRLGR